MRRDAPHFDFGTNRVNIPAKHNKSGEDQWIPLHPQLADIIQALPERAGHVFPFWRNPPEVSKKFKRIATAAGTLHDLRRSFGSRYASVAKALRGPRHSR